MKKILFLLTCMTLSTSVLANPPRRDGHRGPPPEALEACADKQADDECSFEGPRGTVRGVCFSPEADLPLACRPLRKERQ